MSRILSSIVLMLAGLLGCADSLPSIRPPVPTTPQAGSFRLGPGDVIEVMVWDNPNLSRTVPIRPDGVISLPLVDDVAAAGMTPLELRDVLAVHFARFVGHPVVSVIVQQIHSPKVVVMGEVAKPGRFELNGPTTVLDAVALAGGFTEWASKSSVVLLRVEESGVKSYVVDGDALADHQQLVWLVNGDVVVVK